LKKVRATHQVRALRIFFFEGFGILPKKSCGVLFAVEMQASNKDQLFGFLVFVERVAVAIPGRGQTLRTVLSQKLFEDFLPAKFAENVLIQLFPIFSKHRIERGKRNTGGNSAGLVQRGVKNLLGRNRGFLKNV